MAVLVPRARCFAPRSVRAERLEFPNAHVRHELHACFHVFSVHFFPRFRPDNGVKSPNCRFFRGRKPDVVCFQFSPLPFFSKFLHPACTLWNHGDRGFKRVLAVLKLFKNITDLHLSQRDPSVTQIWSNDHNCMLFCSHQIHLGQARSLWSSTMKNLPVAKRHMLF